MTSTDRLRHLSLVSDPRHHGLTPFHIRFQVAESGLVPSLLDDGLRYRHPERDEEVICWAQEPSAIPEVLTYHCGRQWSHLEVVEPC